MRKALLYGAGLIGLFLVVVHFEGASSVTTAATGGLSKVVATLQGR